MRFFTPKAFHTTNSPNAVNIASLEAEELREQARDLRVEANSATTSPEVAASLRQEADELDLKASRFNRLKACNYRLPKW